MLNWPALMCSFPSYVVMYILLGTTGDSWHVKVIKPCADTVRRFLSNDTTLASKDSTNDGGGTRLASRELWTQYVCEVMFFI